uniref:Uncharacterized protein n=1 Tax=Anopheles melas TaxID=34690 RepID=A0A182TKH0_9DIPT
IEKKYHQPTSYSARSCLWSKFCIFSNSALNSVLDFIFSSNMASSSAAGIMARASSSSPFSPPYCVIILTASHAGWLERAQAQEVGHHIQRFVCRHTRLLEVLEQIPHRRQLEELVPYGGELFALQVEQSLLHLLIGQQVAHGQVEQIVQRQQSHKVIEIVGQGAGGRGTGDGTGGHQASDNKCGNLHDARLDWVSFALVSMLWYYYCTELWS